MSRKLLRKHQNEATSKLLESFSGLSELPKNREYPVKSSGNAEEIDPNFFAKTLEKIFEDPDSAIEVDYTKIKDIPLFVLPEMVRALGKMRNRRGVDKSNIVVEMLKFGGPLLE